MLQPISPDEKTWTALIVDDHTYMRSLIRTMLQQIGFKQVEEFDSAEICLRRVRVSEMVIPDVIILDWHMQGMDGYEFCNAFRLDKEIRPKQIPIIMVTGEKDSMLLEQAKDLGVKAILNKPVSLPNLKDAIRRSINGGGPSFKKEG